MLPQHSVSAHWRIGFSRRGAPFDSREYIVRFRLIQPARGGGGGGCCPLLANSISKVTALSADPIILSVGGGCCPLSVRMYVNFNYMGWGWGGRGAIQFQHTHLQPVPGFGGGGGGCPGPTVL